MITLNTIIEEINKIKPTAMEDVDTNINPQTLNGRRGRKRQAEERLQTLAKDYEILLRNNALFLVTIGSERDSFAAVAKEKFNCYAADPELLYVDIANKVPESIINGKESSASLFNLISRHLEDKANDLFALEMPMMTYKQHYNRAIKNKSDLLALTKEAINEQVGGELVGAQAVRSIVHQAIESNHTEKVTPIVLNTSDEKLALELIPALSRMTHRVYLIVAGTAQTTIPLSDEVVNLKEVDEKSVGRTLKAIRRIVRN